MPTGRRDGHVSQASDVANNLLSPTDSLDVQKQRFASKGLNTQDLVTLVGKSSTFHNILLFIIIIFKKNYYYS